MHNDTVSFSLSLDEPPVIVAAAIHRSATSKKIQNYNVTSWGLDFYHHTGKIDFLDHDASVVFNPGDIGITAPLSSIRVIDEDDRDSIYFAFDIQNNKGDPIILPTLMSLGNRFDRLQEMALDAVRAWPVQPARARALLWAILWEIARYHDIGYTIPGGGHPAVREVSEIIELELMEGLSLTNLARRVKLAPSTLSRLFHRQTGSTFVSYIRTRRIKRAAFLLAHTDMPIKEIAFRVGIPDLHVFNKTFRKEMSISPTEYRNLSHQATSKIDQ